MAGWDSFWNAWGKNRDARWNARYEEEKQLREESLLLRLNNTIDAALKSEDPFAYVVSDIQRSYSYTSTHLRGYSKGEQSANVLKLRELRILLPHLERALQVETLHKSDSESRRHALLDALVKDFHARLATAKDE